MERAAYRQMAEVEDRHWWFRARRKILHNLMRRHLSDDGTRHILEVGCGTGGNLGLLRNFGQVSGAELDEEARTFAQEKSGLNIMPCRLPDEVPSAETPYDVVCMFDVLEHIDDDLATLKALQSPLKESGVIVLTVPALQMLWSRHDVLLHHKRRYTKKSLTSVSEAANLRIVDIGYFNAILFPLVLAVRLLTPKTGERDLDNEVPHPVINRTLEAIFGFERYLLGWLKFPIGVSLYLIAQPNREAAAVATHSDSCQKEGQGLTAQASR